MVDSDVNAYRLAVENMARALNDLADPTTTDEAIARYKEVAPEGIATIRREASLDSSEDEFLTFLGEMFEIGRLPPGAGRAVCNTFNTYFYLWLDVATALTGGEPLLAASGEMEREEEGGGAEEGGN